MELNFDKVKVLLVDDDQNFSFALKVLLKAKGLEIDAYSNPEEALEMLKTNKYDMILLDYYMPQMTGEQFLIKLREFDKETIVFLQTAFSEEKPEYEMLKSLNIQGYIDKNKEPNDIFLDIVSGVKMANLLKLVKQQQKEISVLNFKKAIIGELIVQLVNESKDQLFQIGTMIGTIESDTNEYDVQVRCIKNATSKIDELYEALNFEAEDEMTFEQFANTIQILLKAKLLISGAILKFDISDNTLVINHIKELVYVVVKTIEKYLNTDQKELYCNIEKKENKCVIRISAQENNIDIKSIIEINTSENISVEQDNGIIVISVNN